MVRHLLAILVLGFLPQSRSADACTCDKPKTLCANLARTNTVFVGTVRSVPTTIRGDYEVTVEVHEVLAGTPGKTVQIAIRNPGMSCDYGRYKAGEKMLIAGGMRDGKLSVSACSITAPIAEAASDLAELRRLGKTAPATVSGRLSVAYSTPRSNVEVRLGKQTTRTDATGAYQFTVPAGSYPFVPQSDPKLVFRKESDVQVVAGACARHDIDYSWNGRIRGVVRDRSGAPVAGVLVQAFTASQKPPAAWEEAWGPSARTDARGAYDLGPLGPETYRVSVGVPFTPREAYPPSSSPDVKLGPGAIADNIDLVIAPKLPTFKITARVSLTGPGGPRGVSVTATEKASGREYRRYEQPGDIVFVDAAGGTLELRACIGNVGCISRTVKVDRDRVVDLPIETHKINLRASSTATWDWWRVWYDSNYPYSYLIGSPKDKPIEILGIRGNDVSVRACILDPKDRQNDLGCEMIKLTFDRDRDVDLPIN